MNTDTTKATKRKRVIRFFYDFVKEEAWLQDMADKGWAFEKCTYVCYTFRQCTPNTYIVKNTVVENSEEKRAIEEMLVDSGATLCPITWNYWSAISVYAIRDKALGEFEINSTPNNKMHSDMLWLKHIRAFFAFVLLAAIVIGVLLYGKEMTHSDFLIGFATGLATVLLIFILPVYLRIRKRLKGYKADSDIYAS